ncbi:MAG: hypothetical protein PUH04_03415 [Firmicutes bacterium]|nr:hypothetical protein [Blautia sp.]MDD7370670.1 hypothetical protein [Bacillota bacterium]
MNKYTMGYLVEYTKKTESIKSKKKVICSQSKLSELLQQKMVYTIWNAQFIRVYEYQLNHKENPLEEWGF